MWKDYWFEPATWNLESVMCERKFPMSINQDGGICWHENYLHGIKPGVFSLISINKLASEGCRKIWFSTKTPPGGGKKKPFTIFISAMLMHSLSSIMTQISLKNSFGKVVFHILAKTEMMQNKIHVHVDHWPPFWNGIFREVFVSWKWLVYKYIKYSIHHKIMMGKWFLGSHGGPPVH